MLKLHLEVKICTISWKNLLKLLFLVFVTSMVYQKLLLMEKEMKKAAQMLEFEYAAILRDRLVLLRGEKK